MSSLSDSDSGSESDSSLDESGYSSSGSSVEEIPRHPSISCDDGAQSTDVVYFDPVFEDVEREKSSFGDGHEDDGYDVRSVLTRRKKIRSRHEERSARASRLTDCASESDGSKNCDTSDSVVSRRKRKRSTPPSSVSSLSSHSDGEDGILTKRSKRSSDSVSRDEYGDIENEVREVVFAAEQKSLKRGVSRQLSSSGATDSRKLIPAMANVFCPGCRVVQQCYIVDAEVKERPAKEIGLILDHLRTKYSFRLPTDRR
ncbi:hypothetical protein V8E54_008002 [Elaphomyces granulatus]|jgi:hypothetical protein